MWISQTATYALRAVAHLAIAGDSDTPLRSDDVARMTGIPPYFASKVLRRLVVAGICTARKGHHGGFRLARPPAEISFGEVIRAAEPETSPPGCAFGFDKCDLDHPCPLHESWAELKSDFEVWSERTTLADVTSFAERPEVGFRER